MSDVDDETLAAIKSELRKFTLACKGMPDLPIGRLHDCACMGPLPECRCAKRARLIREFLDD